MASEIWAKFYIEMNHDPKVGRLSDRLYRRMTQFFLFAKEYNLDGLLPPVADMAYIIHADEQELLEEMEALAADGVEILTLDEDGNWFVSKFMERQAPDSVAQRVRRHRETKLKQNVSPTLQDMKRDTTQNVTLKEKEKERDKEIEREGEKETEFARAAEPEDKFDILQHAIEQVIGMPQGLDAIQTINELMAVGAEVGDIQDAAAWYRSQNKTIRSAGQLLGPAKEALRKRKQAANIPIRAPGANGNRKSGLSAVDLMLQEVMHGS